jgi:hypothetical protein
LEERPNPSNWSAYPNIWRRRHETEFKARQASILLETTHVVQATTGHLRLKFSSRFHEGEEVPDVL